ncbi:hypothetical protein DPB93_25630 [Salmonella enterica subsp. salamae]|nr:hypothetical protein [Salmonella enterica subsp. salamae]ECI4078902.1 hypothetical protein [Salmonella enterica subsp. salamae]
MTAREVYLQDKKISLTSKEMALLEVFLLNKKHVLSKGYLQDKIFSFMEERS